MWPNEILCRYILEHERLSISIETHRGVVGGHYARKSTMEKVLKVGLCGPTIHKDAKELCQECDVCQRTGNPSRRDDMALVP